MFKKFFNKIFNNAAQPAAFGDSDPDLLNPNRISNTALGWTPLIVAVSEGNVQKVEKLIKAQASLSYVDKDGRTALHHAAQYGQLEIAGKLLEAGANPNAVGAKGTTPLMNALRSSCPLHMVMLLLRYKADANLYDADEKLPLHYAAAGNSADVITALLRATENPDRPDLTGNRPLHLACERNDLAAVQALLYDRITVLSSNNQGETALHLALLNNKDATAEYLLETEAAQLVNAVNLRGQTPLHLAAARSKTALAQKMLEKGAFIDVPDKSDKTPFHAAVDAKNTNLSNIFLQAGAETENNCSKVKVSAMTLAIRNGDAAMVDLLLRRGFDANAPDMRGVTPLMMAAEKGSGEFIAKLLEKGANAAAHDALGRNVLHYCKADTPKDAVQLLIQAGAPLESKDSWHRTPLLCATLDSKIPLALALINYGADVNAKNNNNTTVLHAALQNRNYSIADHIFTLKKRVDTEVKDNQKGWTPLHYACDTSAYRTAENLLKAGANANAPDNEKRTPMHIAVVNSYSRTDLVRLLLDHKGDPLRNNEGGMSPYALANSLNRTQVLGEIERYLKTNKITPPNLPPPPRSPWEWM